MNGPEVVEAEEVTVALVEAVEQLTHQLTPHRAPTVDELREIVASPATTLFVAREGGSVTGMLTLVLVRIPTGVRAHIEDVVVLNSHRRKGIGEKLTRAALAKATAAGARTVDLTSRPTRADAIRLYVRLGFVLRDTGVYRLTSSADS